MYNMRYQKYDSTPVYSQDEAAARAAKRGLWQDKAQVDAHELR